MKPHTVFLTTLLLGVALGACENSAAALPSAQSAMESAKHAAHQTGEAFKHAAVAANIEARELVEKGRDSRAGEKTADILTKTGAKAKEILHTVARKVRNLAQTAKGQVAAGANTTGH